MIKMANGQITTLTRANNTSESLRTTVPSGIIKQFDLKEGDKLAWKLGMGEGDFIIFVRPSKKVPTYDELMEGE
jgi:hypothetical protein